METLDQRIKKNAAISGVIFGAITLVLSIFVFYFITTMVSSVIMMAIVGPFVFSIVIPIVIAILFCNDLRKKIGGFWTLRQATTGIFIMFFVSYVVSTAGSTVFSKVIEPNMVEKMKTSILNATTAMMEKQNVSQEKIDEQVEKVNAQFDGQKDLTFVKIARNFGIAVILIFIISLIFGAFYKREAPLYDLSGNGLDGTA